MIMRQLIVRLPEDLFWDLDGYRGGVSPKLSRAEVVEAALWRFLAPHRRAETAAVERLQLASTFCPKCDEPLSREKGLEWCKRCGFEPEESADKDAPPAKEWTADKELRCDYCHDYFVPGTILTHVEWAHGGGS